MTYSTYENSVQQGDPVELYEFTQGLANYYFITGEDDQVEIDSKIYTALPVQRGRVKQTDNAFKDGLQVDLPRSNVFAQQFVGQIPEVPVTLTVLRGHRSDGDDEYIVYWKGRVISGKGNDNNTITLACESIFTSVKRPGLRAKYELNCRWNLYGTNGCKVNRELYAFNSSISSISTNNQVITVTNASLQADQYYRGGLLVAASGYQRFITDHTGDNVTISRAIPGLLAAQSVTLYPGCDHLATTCLNKFNNLDNFGGFPYIPTKNPFGGSSIV